MGDSQMFFQNLQLKEILTILLSAVTTAVAIFNWRAARFRSKLKDDFEILRRYREEFGEGSSTGASLDSDKKYQCLRDKIQKRMNKAYVMRRTDLSDLISAIAFFLSAVVVWLQTEGWTLSSRIGIVIVLAGVGLAFLYAALKDRGQDRI